MANHLAERVEDRHGIVDVDCDCGTPRELAEIYLVAMAVCATGTNRLLVRTGAADGGHYPELRNALVRLFLTGHPGGFRIAFLGQPDRRKAGFASLLSDLVRLGIRVEWFESEHDALAWLGTARAG